MMLSGCGETGGGPQIANTSHLEGAYRFGKRLYAGGEED